MPQTIRFLLIALLPLLSSCWMLRAYKVRKLQLTDHRKLPSVPIRPSSEPFHFTPVGNKSAYQHVERLADSVIAKTETAAFLVIRNDSLIYEKYFLGFDEHSLLPSNSMAKSFTGTLVGIALKEGTIRSEEDAITRYLPELGRRDPRFHAITLRHLLDMRSGLDFNEGSYNLRDDAVRLGFRPNLVKHILRVKIRERPGHFRYQSVNTQLLGLIVERATGQRLQDYLEAKLWQPMGASQGATWNVDSRKRKHVITSAALNATARDFAKLGRLYLLQGRIQGRQVISSDWTKSVSNLDTLEKYEGYKYQWWNKRGTRYYRDSVARALKIRVPGNRKRQRIARTNIGYNLGYPVAAFNAYGFLDQIIYVHPAKKLIIVRLGRGWKDETRFTQSIYDLGERL